MSNKKRGYFLKKETAGLKANPFPFTFLIIKKKKKKIVLDFYDMKGIEMV